MLVNSDAALVRRKPKRTSADKVEDMDEKVFYCIPQSRSLKERFYNRIAFSLNVRGFQ